MKASIRWTVGLAALSALLLPAARSGNDLDSLLALIPKDAAAVIVVPDLNTLEQSVGSVGKSLGFPISISPEMVYGPLESQVDLSKPFAMVFLAAKDRRPVFFYSVKSFEEAMKTLEAKEGEKGIWEYSDAETMLNFATPKGSFAVVAAERGQLRFASGASDSLQMIATAKDIRDSQVFAHVSVAAWKETVGIGMKKARAFLPMIAAAAGAQGGNPAAMTQLYSSFFDFAEEVVAQGSNLDALVRIDEKRLHMSFLGNFEKGPIASYLAEQKQGKADLLEGLPEKDLTFALGLHFPGDQSKAIDYVMTKISPKGGEDFGKRLTESFKVSQGVSMGMLFHETGMEVYGQYINGQPKHLLEAMKDLLTKPNQWMETFAGGVTYEPTGSRTLGTQEVFDFQPNYEDAPVAIQDMMEKLYPPEFRATYAATSTALRFSMGMPKATESFFTDAKIAPFRGSPDVQATLKALPASKNIVVLLDLAGIGNFTIMQRNQALKDPSKDATPLLKPGQPLGFSTSLSEGVARVDLFIPWAPLQDLVKSFLPSSNTSMSGGMGLLPVGSMAPDWELKTPEGKVVSLKSLRGNVVVLDFWATWCKPCKMAMPGVQKLHEKFQGKPVAVYGVNCWEEDSANAVAYMKDKKYSYGLLLEGNSLAEKFKVSGIPTFYVLSPEGKILHASSGFGGDEDALAEIVEKAIPK